MWRTGYDDEWKRRKEYLIRSLFDEVSLLSPVAEAAESYSDESPSRRDVRKPSDLLPSTVETRPYSPLPSLIIEKEPNRHDEPTEHYKQLELKMRRMYRRLFIEDRSVTSSLLMSDDGSRSVESQDQNADEEMQTIALQRMNQGMNDSDHESYINDDLELEEDENNTDSSLNNNNTPQKSVYDFDINIPQRLSATHSVDVESCNGHIESPKIEGVNTSRDVDSNSESFEEEPDNITSSRKHELERQDEPLRKINTSDTNIHEDLITTQFEIMKNYTRSSSSVSSTECVQKITFEAQVHKEDNVGDIESHREFYEESENYVLFNVSGENSCEDRISMLENVDEEQVPESDKESEKCATKEKEDIEIMRTPRLNPSTGSFQNEITEHDNSYISIGRRKTKKRPLESYSPSEILGDKTNLMDVERCSDDFSHILQSSTPKGTRKRRTNVKSTLNNEVSPVIHRISNKRRICEDAAVQVSDNRASWSSLRHNLFVGTPKIFKLCSCKNIFCYC